MYATISPFSKTFDEIGLIYTVPDFLSENISIGNIVEIPMKSNIEIGVVLELSKNINTNYDDSKIKSIISIKNSNIFLSSYRIDILKWIAKYYITAIHNSLNLFFPKNLKDKITKNKLKIESNKVYTYNFNYDIKLTSEQLKAYDSIIKSSNNQILLYGLTGSGKTEIYINLIKKYLDSGKQSLFLIPEIILTNQLSEKIKKVYGEDVLIINSTITDATKTKYWIDINNSDAKIIIGTRSAIFYPYKNLGLIIIDEEHDNSYISDSSPRYNTIEIAEKITQLNGNKLVLGSGTPSIKSMYKGVKGKYDLVNLVNVYKKK